MTNPARILAIAGSDSSGGAGIQADIKTITMLGGYAMTAITAITAQNTLGVQGVQPVTSDMVFKQFQACSTDIGIDAIKIGMIGSATTALMVWDMLIAQPDAIPIVFDPVMVATSGSSLADAEAIAAFREIMDLATVVTPNLPELAALTDMPASSSTDIAAAAAHLAAKHDCHVLAKGGHGDGEILLDLLMAPDGTSKGFGGTRINTRHTHGTGCTLSSALATFLGQGLALEAATARAIEFVRLALHDAPGFGAKAGPLGHQSVRMDLTDEPRLNQITLAAGEYGETVLFYRALGLIQIVDSPSNGYARFESPGGTTLSISTGHDETGGASIYFECLDLAAQLDRLRANGIACPAPQDQSWNWRESWITDPSGNRICFYAAGEDRRYPPWRIG
ncbi:hypothetical protein GCM10023115_08710 [Pontixanthobacter gangjinensis]|uniref:hydroxymethylpyrimidine kinase n=1 Tax=Pontixanthobacter gangjinensis TaxID=1028742 RepID=A0A6I4SMS3_9SPHN|nr:bifunctional hydroxymethylpyrimidine kinase/phosphomethylpyrimidine kinase [Pontixanthobacter gangjinensis]MXO56117.1 bifunctional hydroxymethylpyrimidine kinase/phosphomethylpyrimidine kinase [Pontixanthobacter gangjinensis]